MAEYEAIAVTFDGNRRGTGPVPFLQAEKWLEEMRAESVPPTELMYSEIVGPGCRHDEGVVVRHAVIQALLARAEATIGTPESALVSSWNESTLPLAGLDLIVRFGNESLRRLGRILADIREVAKRDVGALKPLPLELSANLARLWRALYVLRNVPPEIGWVLPDRPTI